MRVRDGRGIAMELGEAIKRGGEAEIRLVKGKPALVAKVYHADKVRGEHEAKLKAMLANAPTPPATHTALAWPIQLLYQRGQLVGFLMPKIDGYDRLFNFYNPVLRKKRYPGFNWRYLHRTAINLAVVIETVHEAGHLIGDLNESNILVNDQALVTLVDTDSFQIQDPKGWMQYRKTHTSRPAPTPSPSPNTRGGEPPSLSIGGGAGGGGGWIYNCPVGKAEYTPPELQGARFDQLNRSQEHDYFGLAVLIFQLLMEGYHPFSGILPADLSVGRVDVYGIREGLFPYGQNGKSSGIQTPPHAPSFTLLHPDLQALFIRCFVDGHHNPTLRPTAREWRAHLERAEEALAACERDATHIYSHHLAGCPFCAPKPAIQKPLPPALQKAIPSLSATSGQSSSLRPTFISISMQSLGQLLPNRSRSVLKLVWNVILIATVAITWLRISGFAMSPESPAIAQPPTSIAVVEDTKTVATHTKTASPQPPASETGVATHTKTASPQPPTSETVTKSVATHTKTASPQPAASETVVEPSKSVARHTKTASPQPAASETGVATHTKTASPQPPASTIVVEHTKTATESRPAAGEGSVAGGMACFGSFGFGVTCLDDAAPKRAVSGWRSFSEDDSSLGGDLIYDMATCPDSEARAANTLLIAHTSGISAFDGQKWAEYGHEWGSGSPDRIACDADGGIWVAHYKGVSYFDGQRWTTTPSKQLATGDDANDLVKDVALAPDGQVWVATSHTIATTSDGNEWTVYQQGQGFGKQYFLSSVVVDHQGEVWAAYSRGLLHFDGTNWTEHKGLDFISAQTLTVDGDRNIWVGTFGYGLKRFSGQNWVTYDTQNSGLMSNYVHSLAVDAQGRVWAGTEWGLSVFDGTNWQTYQMDSADLVDNDIRTLAVIGGGPAFPEAMDKENGSFSGQLLNSDEQPIANATIEVCVGILSFYFSDTPCEDQPFILQTTTDADGNFTVADVPVGRYVMAINIAEEQWVELKDESGFGSRDILVNAGEETDLSTLILESEDS